jgi:hypothetical protein
MAVWAQDEVLLDFTPAAGAEFAFLYALEQSFFLKGLFVGFG